MVTKHNHFSIKTNPGKIDFNIRSVALVKRVKQNDFPDFQYLHSRRICNLLQRFENTNFRAWFPHHFIIDFLFPSINFYRYRIYSIREGEVSIHLAYIEKPIIES